LTERPAARELIIAEGEGDTLCALSKGLIAVTATGGAGTWHNDWSKCFKGLQVIVAFDNDAAGKNGAQKVAQSLVGITKSVEIVEWPNFMDDSQDLTDFFVTHGKRINDFSALPRRKVIREQKSKGGGEKRSQLPPNEDDSLYQFNSFEVLGEHEDNRIFFASHDVGKIHAVTLRDFTLEKLIQIGGDEVRFRVVRRMESLSGELKAGNPHRKVHFNDLRKQIILQARRNQLGVPKWLGQGCHALSDDRIAIVNGNRVLIWDDRSFFSFDGAMIEEKLIRRSAGRAWFEEGRLVNLVLGMDKAQGKKIIEELVEVVAQWGFAGGFDLALLCGFLLAQVVQHIFDWRPMLWLCGMHGSGKSLFLKFAEELGGALARRFEGSLTSEAGFRQSLKADLNLVSIDEFEKSGSRDLIMSILRSSGRGGVGSKGTPSQESVEFALQHMILVASIESGILEAADAVRFIAISTKKDPSRDPHLLSVREMEVFRSKFLALAIWAGLKARRMVRNLKRIPGYDPRLAEAHAVLLSMVTVADENPQEGLESLLEKVLIDREESGGSVVEEDESRLLNDIFASTLRVDVSEDEGHTLYADRSMSWLARSSSIAHKADLEACGIKEVEGGVFLACSLISRRLLKDTSWKSLNIASILQRVPGAVRAKKRIDGRPLWGVFFPDKGEILGMAGGTAQAEKDLIFS
ncbi:MAG: toprim domain-containing protein, partial [Deltaproteobacteria bacterium]|nr:toprim domain-containing protein [Deltaproteobacteria bacterium]